MDYVAVRVISGRHDDRSGIGDRRRAIELVVRVRCQVTVRVGPRLDVPVPIISEAGGVQPSGGSLVRPPTVRVVLVRRREETGVRFVDEVASGVVAEDGGVAARLGLLQCFGQGHVDLELGYVLVWIGHFGQVASRVERKAR